MSKVVEQDSNMTLYANFLTQAGAEAMVVGTPTITISHVYGSVTKTDASAVNMTLLSGSLYYYTFHVAAAADKGHYIARYDATYSDSTNAKGSETFQVVKQNFFERASSGGSFNKTVIKDIWTTKEKQDLITALVTMKDEIMATKLEIAQKMIGIVEVSDMVGTEISGVKNILQEKPNAVSDEKYEEYSSKMNSLVNELSQKIDTILRNPPEKFPMGEIETMKTSLGEIKALNESNLTNFTTDLSGVNNRLEKLEDSISQISKIIIKQADINILKEVAENVN